MSKYNNLKSKKSYFYSMYVHYAENCAVLRLALSRNGNAGDTQGTQNNRNRKPQNRYENKIVRHVTKSSAPFLCVVRGNNISRR